MSVRENKQAGRPWFAFEGVQNRHTLIFSQLVKGWGGKLGFGYSIDDHIVLSMGGSALVPEDGDRPVDLLIIEINDGLLFDILQTPKKKMPE